MTVAEAEKQGRKRPGLRVRLGALAVALACWAAPAAAQHPLSFINEETQVRDVDFEFTDTHTFSDSELLLQIANQEPGFGDFLRRILPLVDETPRPLLPVEVARDVHRLESFYRENGFLRTEIDYRASELDTTENEIRLVFTITEGPPLIIQDVGFTGPDGGAAFYALPEDLREDWTEFRERITVRTGDRYTTFDRIRIQDQTLTWLRNRGFAFAQTSADVAIDSLANTADLAFSVAPGPIATIDSIRVEGNRSVSDRTILREMPFEVGDRFSQQKLTEGQRGLYRLNLFRIAVIDMPEQPRDSTVTLLIQVREGRPRYVSAQVGYGVEAGATAQAEWTHRNFFGGARTFTAGAVAQSGVGANLTNGQLPERLYRLTASLTQPYLFTRRLSVTVAPFIQAQRDPQIRAGENVTLTARDPFQFNVREAGVNTSFLYEFFPFRSLQLQHSFSRALLRSRSNQFVSPDTSTAGLSRDVYDRSVLSLNGVLGRVNNFLDPTRGFLVRPFVESGGAFLASDIEYFKFGSEATAYWPITPTYNLRGRLFAGQIQPFGFSRTALLGDVSEVQRERWERRFQDVLFYAGGQTLRGWPAGLAGDKRLVPVIVRRGDDDLDTTRFVWDPRGGLQQLGANVELRLPFPGLGPSWGTAVFADAVVIDRRTFRYSNLFADVGAGIRYRTVIGYIRLDLAYKLNPDEQDLWKATHHNYLIQEGRLPPGTDPETSWLKRFNVVLSIGPAF